MPELLLLRLIHILGGVFWVGTMLFTTLFLIPALASSGAAAGEIMAALQRRRLMIVLPLVALLTILSGIRLMWITSGGFAAAYFGAPMGRTLAWAAAFAIVAFLIGVLVARPAAMRTGALARALATAPAEGRHAIAADMARVQRRNSVATLVTLVLLIASASGMAVARYL